MNKQRKDAAVKKYGPLKDQGKDAVVEALTADKEKNYTDQEVGEISEAIMNGDTPAPPSTDNNSKAKEETKPNANRYYEEYNVEPIYEMVENPATGREDRKLKGKDRKKAPFGTDESFEKVGKAIRGTWITPENAELMNQHSETAKRRFFEATPPAKK